jgi:hypothetical protein
MEFNPRRFNTGSFRAPAKAPILLKGHVQAYIWDKKQVPTFADYLRIQRRNELDKYAVWKDKGDNLIVNPGLGQIIALLLGSSTISFPSCGVGSGTNTPTPTDSDLQTPITRISVTQLSPSANIGYWNTFFAGSVGNGTWNETGLFSTNTLASGIMLCRKLFGSSFVKTSSNTGTVAWTITATAV